jgi:hypothetical protein
LCRFFLGDPQRNSYLIGPITGNSLFLFEGDQEKPQPEYILRGFKGIIFIGPGILPDVMKFPPEFFNYFLIFSERFSAGLRLTFGEMKIVFRRKG